MPAHPFATFEPFSTAILRDVGWQFAFTFAVFVAVVCGAMVSRLRRPSALGERLVVTLERHRRASAARSAGRAGLWALPLLVWALQISWRMESLWSDCCHPTNAYALRTLYVAGLALAALIVAQSVAVLLVEGPHGRRLGVGGGLRVGIRCALLTVVLDGLVVASMLPSSYY